eukprot:746798-Pleurochrysis_carterae.AAC.1
MVRIARSATPFSACTCGGDVVACTEASASSTSGGGTTRVEQRVEFGQKPFHARGCVCARFQKIHDFKAGMVVHENKQIFVTTTSRHERASDVSVNDSARVGGQARRICRRARVTRTHGGTAERGRCVRGDVGQGAEA